jgi:hypothetical protein
VSKDSDSVRAKGTATLSRSGTMSGAVDIPAMNERAQPAQIVDPADLSDLAVLIRDRTVAWG